MKVSHAGVRRQFPVPHIQHDEVHLWRCSLEVAPAALQAAFDVLSDEELRRAGRFYFVPDRNQFVLTRGMLRRIIGRYLAVDPVRLTFRTGPLGKPALAGDLRFNVSHSCGRAVLAVAWGREVGVDIECLRPDIDIDSIAERLFAAAERHALQRLPRPRRRAAFFTCWTRKEAYVKARGLGFALPLDSFAVSVDPKGPARFVYDEPGQVGRWALRAFDPGIGSVGALAVEGAGWRLREWEYEPAN